MRSPCLKFQQAGLQELKSAAPMASRRSPAQRGAPSRPTQSVCTDRGTGVERTFAVVEEDEGGGDGVGLGEPEGFLALW